MLHILRRVISHPSRYLVILTLLIASALNVSLAQEGSHGGFDGNPRPELQHASSVTLNPQAATEIGSVYEAYLSPQQEGDEEANTPPFIPRAFQSTQPSVPREERPGRGHAVIEFTNDLSRAYVHLAVTDVDPEDVVLLHLHCGRPSQLGPIIVDFGLIGDFTDYLADGTMSVEITNADIEAVIDNREGFVGAFTAGCPIVPPNTNDNFTTIGGLEFAALQGELYFNLHTSSQTFFGDIRGAFRPVVTANSGQ